MVNLPLKTWRARQVHPGEWRIVLTDTAGNDWTSAKMDADILRMWRTHYHKQGLREL